MTVGSKGVRQTVGIPGSGLSWTKYSPHKKQNTQNGEVFINKSELPFYYRGWFIAILAFLTGGLFFLPAIFCYVKRRKRIAILQAKAAVSDARFEAIVTHSELIAKSFKLLENTSSTSVFLKHITEIMETRESLLQLVPDVASRVSDDHYKEIMNIPSTLAIIISYKIPALIDRLSRFKTKKHQIAQLNEMISAIENYIPPTDEIKELLSQKVIELKTIQMDIKQPH